MKRQLAVLASLGLLASLSACSGDKPKTDDKAAASADKAKADKAEDEAKKKPNPWASDAPGEAAADTTPAAPADKPAEAAKRKPSPWASDAAIEAAKAEEAAKEKK